jgi:hypothetical protein
MFMMYCIVLYCIVLYGSVAFLSNKFRPVVLKLLHEYEVTMSLTDNVDEKGYRKLR